MVDDKRIPTLLIGYDVESPEPDITRAFLKKLLEVHTKYDVPWTMFVVGRTLEGSVDAFKEVAESPLADIQQHTYSHMLLKTVVIENEDGVNIFRSGTLEQIEEEVRKTNELLKLHLNIDCIGLTGPYCYYRGLADRLDILEILHQNGIRFTRTYGRNEHDWQPVSFDIQPFYYEPQGFPDILEFPIQGWQDVSWREKYGWDKIDEYIASLKDNIDYVVEKKLTYSYATHDWSSIRNNPDMDIIRALIEYAQERGVRITSYKEYYEEMESRRNSLMDI